MRSYPDWLKKKFSPDGTSRLVDGLLNELELESVCEHAACPNRHECYSRRQLTFLILGKVCTRSCRFCGISSGRPDSVSFNEPYRLAQAVNRIGLEHVVITSVTRDDLPDEGAGQFVRVMEALRSLSKDLSIELLVPDFHARRDLIEKVIESSPDVFAHNIETVERLSGKLRPQGDYRRSLEVLRIASSMTKKSIIKSGIMVGLGESPYEVHGTLEDLLGAGCSHITIGQYLKPSEESVSVSEYVSPQMFSEYEKLAYKAGFRWVMSGPFVRSSYRAIDAIKAFECEACKV
jgi:lipoic acid synthetase